MKTYTRKITADATGKNLFIKVNGKVITSAWGLSKFYENDRVTVIREKERGIPKFFVRYLDTRLPFIESHWTVVG